MAPPGLCLNCCWARSLVPEGQGLGVGQPDLRGAFLPEAVRSGALEARRGRVRGSPAWGSVPSVWPPLGCWPPHASC